MLCDPVMTEAETAPELAKVTGLPNICTVRKAQANEKALIEALTAWEKPGRHGD